jgi:hypothetical protein
VILFARSLTRRVFLPQFEASAIRSPTRYAAFFIQSEHNNRSPLLVDRETFYRTASAALTEAVRGGGSIVRRSSRPWGEISSSGTQAASGSPRTAESITSSAQHEHVSRRNPISALGR